MVVMNAVFGHEKGKRGVTKEKTLNSEHRTLNLEQRMGEAITPWYSLIRPRTPSIYFSGMNHEATKGTKFFYHR
jgi:hypothetical protein